MKRLLNLFCIAALAALLLCLLPTAAFAAEITGECGDQGANITYSYDPDTYVLTLTGSGATKNFSSYGSGRSPFVTNTTIKNNCKTIVIGEGITRIGDYTFNTLTKVESITWPSTLESVGTLSFASMPLMSAFPQGSSIATIGERAFSGWTTATELTLPETLVTIGTGAFGSWKPASLTIPASVRTINASAFSGWTNLETLVIENGVETIGANAFASTKLTEVNIPASVISLDATSFGGNNIAAINVDEANTAYCSVGGVLYTKDKDQLIRCPEGYQGEVVMDPACTAIVDRAFYNCPGVDSVVLSQNLVSIGGDCFEGTSITSITIPESVTEISSGAFASCGELVNATVNASVDALPSMLFSGCSKLETVTIGEDVGGYGASCFQGCSSLTGVTSIAGAASIPEYCFYMCSSLAHFDIPDSVTYIGNSAFAECGALEEIVIPEGVTSIGMYAFQRCSSITELTVPAGITSIPGFMCQFCTSLEEVTVLGDITQATNLSIENNAFGACTALKKITFNCPCPDTKKLAKGAFNNAATVVKVFYPEDYPEWGEVRPFDVCNMKNYIYIPLRSTPEIELVGAEIRARAANDSWRDIRFIAKLSPAYNGTEVTRRYAEVVRHDNGAQLNIECKKDYRHNPDETVIFTLVVTGIRPEYRDVDISVTMHIEYEGPNSGTAETDTITTNVNLLENSD